MARSNFSGPLRSSLGYEVGQGSAALTVINAAGAINPGGLGTPITQIRVYSQTITPASVAAATTAQQTFTVTGLATTDTVIVNGPAPTAGTGIVNAFVSAANTLAVTFVNPTAGALVPVSGTYVITAFRR